MPSTREIRRRIRSVRNISQVTRAMEMVAASKMRRAQNQVLATRPYSEKAWQILTDLASQAGMAQPPLMVAHPVQSIGLVLITADRGLCGGFNHNILREAVRFIAARNRPVRLITIGRKGRDWMLRYGREIHAEFPRPGDQPGLLDIAPIARVVIEDFTTKVFDEVYLAYTRFVNTMVQRPTIRKILPIEPTVAEARSMAEYIFEPDPQTILAEVVPRFTELQVYQAVLESIASEHSARMVAMRSATDNAKDLLGVLTLTFNKVRQAGITMEMLDIVGGAEALRRAQAAR